MRLVSFALGSIYKWSLSDNRTSLIKIARKLDVDGIEITLGKKENVFDFKMSASDIKFFRGLKYVTIHAPFKLIRRAESEEEVWNVLKIIDSIYKKVGAKNVVMHPRDIPEPDILDSFKLNVITENMPKIVKIKNKTLTLDDVFTKYPNIGLCLDVAHAYRKSKIETRNIVRKYGNRIKQIHLSGTYKGEDHLSLNCVTRDFFKSIEPIEALNVPIIIEEDFEKVNLNVVKNEIELVKNLFLQ